VIAGIHRAATHGFRGAEQYERARPDYPAEAIAELVRALRLGPASRTVELGAGTGKLTRALLPRCGLLVAVEPVAEMRRELAARVPGARVLGAVAEALPLRARTASAVASGQAFHWFANREALDEIHRVLVPGGRLGLVWNQRDESVGWVRRLQEMLEPLEGDAPRFRTGRWREAFRGQSLLGPLAEASFAHEQVGPPEMVVARVASISFVAALPSDRREEVLGEVRRLLASDAATAGRDEIRLPYRTHVYWCERG
jgi:SAM-dependent methyltransferase